MASTENHSGKQRPGGRTARTSERINTAVLDSLVTGGPDSCTFTNVAEKAGVERSTLYRRYGNRWAMISEAYTARAAQDLSIVATGNFRADIKAHLRSIADSLSSTLGRAMLAAAAIARVEETPEAGRYWRARREQIRPILDKAVVTGEARAGIDPDEFFAAADGPLFFRLLIAGAPIDDEFIGRVVDNLWRLYGRTDGVGHAEKETAS
jgi:AcrR family transcriptional regulator